jgi:hypothetical protein
MSSLPEAEYFDCELPSVRRQLSDPEGLLGRLQGRRVALDEIHRLPDPSEFLKIAADHFPNVRVIATGPSMLQASTKCVPSRPGRRTRTPGPRADLPCGTVHPGSGTVHPGSGTAYPRAWDGVPAKAGCTV